MKPLNLKNEVKEIFKDIEKKERKMEIMRKELR